MLRGYVPILGLGLLGAALFELKYSLTRKLFKFVKKITRKPKFVVLIHGGAGVITKETNSKPYLDALKTILRQVFMFAELRFNVDQMVTAVDVAEYAVTLLENNPLFNAGLGSVFTTDNTHELEASIMDGSTLESGAVSIIKNVKNPICLARIVMSNTPHRYLVGTHAEKLAVLKNLEIVDENYFSTPYRHAQLEEAKKADRIVADHDLHINDTYDKINNNTGTVGCVCMLNRHVAAATSTGGLTNKYSGRIGDTPIIGAGTYANDTTCAISTTGKGETILKYLAAYDISAKMKYLGYTLNHAIHSLLFNDMPSDTCGVIAVTPNGKYNMRFNTKGMFRGFCDEYGNCQIGIWKEMISFKIA